MASRRVSRVSAIVRIRPPVDQIGCGDVERAETGNVQSDYLLSRPACGEALTARRIPLRRPCQWNTLYHNDGGGNSHLEWNVKYAPGVLEARGTKNGAVVLTVKRETTGAPAKLVLRPDRLQIAADGEDLSVVAVEVVDAEGRIVPTAGNDITFRVEGHGRLIGLGNGDPSCHEADKPSSATEGKRSAFNGLCMGFVQALKQPGNIRVEASSAGLASSAVVIKAEEAKLRPAT